MERKLGADMKFVRCSRLLGEPGPDICEHRQILNSLWDISHLVSIGYEHITR